MALLVLIAYVCRASVALEEDGRGGEGGEARGFCYRFIGETKHSILSSLMYKL